MYLIKPHDHYITQICLLEIKPCHNKHRSKWGEPIQASVDLNNLPTSWTSIFNCPQEKKLVHGKVKLENMFLLLKQNFFPKCLILESNISLSPLPTSQQVWLLPLRSKQLKSCCCLYGISMCRNWQGARFQQWNQHRHYIHGGQVNILKENPVASLYSL